MKTLTYLPTLLALTIQVMVIGQTQDNQARKIRIDIMGPKEPVKMNYANSNVTLSMTEYNQLLEQVNSLKINAKKLREEASSIETQSLVKQIEASEMAGIISNQKFEHNKTLILDVFTKIQKNTITYTKAQGSYSESERFMKLAKEMREEANAQFSLQAKLGNMSNAEETEVLALNKQTEILNLFEQAYPQVTQNIRTMITENKNMTNQQSTLIYKESNKTIGIKMPHTTYDLLASVSEQAYEMKATAQQLRVSALTSSPNQKTILINEAISLENDYVLKQVEISMLKSKMNYEKFNQNRTVIDLLLEKAKANTELVNKVTQLNNEAERLMKIGKEMREEANAQLTNAAKYGAMSNAQETETLALGKQHESIQVIERNNSKMIVACR